MLKKKNPKEVILSLFFGLLYVLTDWTASEMTGNRVREREREMGLYAAKCPRPGLKPRAPAVRTEPLYIGHALYQLSQWAPPCHHLTSQCAWETLKPREDMFYRTCRCECWLLKSWHQMCITSYAIFEECHGFHEYFKVHRTDHAMCSAGFRNFEKYGVCWKTKLMS